MPKNKDNHRLEVKETDSKESFEDITIDDFFELLEKFHQWVLVSV